ncbi:hypothetical protein SK128_002591 [Halocaridina rubra]|uniref:Uncharacterized protein n=1 Tax=Halocaridina rubra TaxID=373956 RepID=A0AAN9AAE3_HALRR
MSQLAWFISSQLVEERPFGSASCMTGNYEPASIRITLSFVFNFTCVILTLATYIGIAITSKPSVIGSDRKQRNIITVKTGIIQSAFLLLTFLLPLVTRLLSYRGLISPQTLAQGNMIWINFSQCSVYPLITIISSSVLRRATSNIIKSLCQNISPNNSYRRRRKRKIEPMTETFSAADGSLVFTCQRDPHRAGNTIPSSELHLPEYTRPTDSSTVAVNTDTDAQYSGTIIFFPKEQPNETDFNIFRTKAGFKCWAPQGK